MQISALRARLNSALLEFAWDEWAQMGVLTTREHRWAQDPEALLLLTLEVARDDPRLFDEVLDWLVRNEPLISLRRIRRAVRWTRGRAVSRRGARMGKAPAATARSRSSP